MLTATATPTRCHFCRTDGVSLAAVNADDVVVPACSGCLADDGPAVAHGFRVCLTADSRRLRAQVATITVGHGEDTYPAALCPRCGGAGTLPDPADLFAAVDCGRCEGDGFVAER